MRDRTDMAAALAEVSARLTALEHSSELIKTVLMVKEPESLHAASTFDGLRKQVIASSSERRSHLAQLVAMAVAVGRAGSVDDLRPQVQEWLAQAGIVEVRELTRGMVAQEYFEPIDGADLDSAEALEISEPAYVDSVTHVLLRLGRARPASPAATAASRPSTAEEQSADTTPAHEAPSESGLAEDGPAA